jgi:signal transduction histidine kinase
VFSEGKLNELAVMAEFGGYYKYVWKKVREIQNELKKISFSKWLEANYGN